MKKELRDKIIAYNAEKAEGARARADIMIIFSSLSSKQKKQLAKNDAVREIFARYGIDA
ncbi:MAG: hypothetical protein VB039_10255 [Oscillospiraceae bacterium]|nr:hypothetical protein [Oscillospiraceae bacterium]